MSATNYILDQLRHSPQLPQIVASLQKQLELEQQRRQFFYQQINEPQKAEFIDGEIIVHSPARNRHLSVVLNIACILRTFVVARGLGTVNAEKCLCRFPRNDYEPDVVFFGLEKSSQFTDETLIFPIPDLAVEVLSESTAGRDRGVKFQDFAANGVGEYWIVDSDAEIVEQFSTFGDEYQLVSKHTSNDRLNSFVIAGLDVSVSAFFYADHNLAELSRLVQESGSRFEQA
jgi:Uma2 family endonuclease